MSAKRPRAAHVPELGFINFALNRLAVGRWFLLLDDLVGELQDRVRHREAERLGGVEIDDQLECRWLLNRQKDLSEVSTDLMPPAGDARSIADQATGLDESTHLRDRRNLMACRQRYELLAPAFEGTRRDRQRRRSGSSR